MSTPVNDAFTPPSTAYPPPPNATLTAAVDAREPRHDWSKDEIRAIYNTPLMELAFQAVSGRST